MAHSGLFCLIVAVAGLLLAILRFTLFRDVFEDLRHLLHVRGTRRSLRALRKFGLGTLLWVTAGVAVTAAVIRGYWEDPVGMLLGPMTLAGFVLAKVAWQTTMDRGIRRTKLQKGKPSFDFLDSKSSRPNLADTAVGKCHRDECRCLSAMTRKRRDYHGIHGVTENTSRSRFCPLLKISTRWAT
ncbi:MAG: hypothetical protein AAGD07_04105 [Planctomycetota bacterium]